MNKQVIEMFVKSVFFFVTGVILASLFVWSMMQGILIHMTNPGRSGFPAPDSIAFTYYFVGWISGVAALALYWQAKNLFHFAKISQ